MTDDRARRIREIRNRTKGTAEGNGNETGDGTAAEDTDDGETPGASDAESDAQSGEEREPSANDEASADGAHEGERDDASESDDAASSGTDERDGTDAGETVSYDEDEAVAAAEPAADESAGDSEVGAASEADLESGTGTEAEVEGESEPRPTTNAAGGGGGTLGGAISSTAGGAGDSNGAIEASLQGAIAGMSETMTVDERVGEATVDATALGQQSDTYGEAAAGREQVFDRGDSLVASTHNEEDTVQMLEFFLNENRYAIEIERISAIVEMKEITRFPRGPDAIDGVTDLRGEITGVLDPTVMLDVERSEPSDDHYIVVLERDGDKQKLGIRVTDVLQAVTYRESQIDETGSVMDDGGAQHEFVDGIVKKETDEGTALVAWLDVDALIESTEMDHRPGERLSEQSA